MSGVKRILAGLGCLCVVLLSGCGSISGTDGLIEKAREEIPLSETELENKNIGNL